MCLDPISLAVVGLAGGVVQGIGAASQANTQAASDNMQADALDSQIDTTQKTADYNVNQAKDTLATTLGAQRAGYAANGIDSSTGSALDVQRDSAESGALDVASIRWNATVDVNNLKYQQAVLRSNASAASASAPLAFLSPVIGSVAKFGGSFGS